MPRSALPPLPRQYVPFTEERAVTASSLLAYLPPGSAHPDLEALRARLGTQAKVTRVGEFRAPSGDHGSFLFGHGRGAAELSFELHLVEGHGVHFTATMNDPTDEELHEAMDSEWCLRLTTHLGGGVVADFHTQLELLDIVAPDAVWVHDFAANRSHAGTWLRDVARASVPPAPDTLFTEHLICNVPDGAAWYHSHGLHRCGCIELEMFDIPVAAAHAFRFLFHATAARFIEKGTPPAGEVFEVGQDLSLYWLPWEDAIDALPPSAPGAGADRDEHHDHAAGVLFAADPADDGRVAKRPRNVTVLREILEAEPVLFVSKHETQRMSLLAKTHYSRFRSIQQRFGTSEGWGFQVKLGYQVDDCPEEDDDNEHLWFDVHQIHGAEVVATLLNRPHRIARMREGETDRHAIDQMSDWSIESPHGVFDAGSIARLEEFVGP